MDKMIKCLKCGTDNERGAKFCEECGAKIISEKKYLKDIMFSKKWILITSVIIILIIAVFSFPLIFKKPVDIIGSEDEKLSLDKDEEIEKEIIEPPIQICSFSESNLLCHDVEIKTEEIILTLEKKDDKDYHLFIEGCYEGSTEKSKVGEAQTVKFIRCNNGKVGANVSKKIRATYPMPTKYGYNITGLFYGEISGIISGESAPQTLNFLTLDKGIVLEKDNGYSLSFDVDDISYNHLTKYDYDVCLSFTSTGFNDDYEIYVNEKRINDECDMRTPIQEGINHVEIFSSDEIRLLNLEINAYYKG